MKNLKEYFIRLLLALLNKGYTKCDCNLTEIGVYKRSDLNPEFLKTIDAIEKRMIENRKKYIKDGVVTRKNNKTYKP